MSGPAALASQRRLSMLHLCRGVPPWAQLAADSSVACRCMAPPRALPFHHHRRLRPQVPCFRFVLLLSGMRHAGELRRRSIVSVWGVMPVRRWHKVPHLVMRAAPPESMSCVMVQHR